jgi:hypothetical protein
MNGVRAPERSDAAVSGCPGTTAPPPLFKSRSRMNNRRLVEQAVNPRKRPLGDVVS